VNSWIAEQILDCSRFRDDPLEQIVISLPPGYRFTDQYSCSYFFKLKIKKLKK